MRKTMDALWSWILIVGITAILGLSSQGFTQEPVFEGTGDEPAQVEQVPEGTGDELPQVVIPAETPEQDPQAENNEEVDAQAGGDEEEADILAGEGEETEASEEACVDECEIGDRMCTEDGGASWCVHQGECRVWTEELICREGQSCEGDNGRCTSAGVGYLIWFGIALMILAFFYIVWGYTKGMTGSPREIYILFATKVVEYTAYGAMNMTFVLFLSEKVGLSDIGAGSFIAAWSLGISLTTMVVGALVDAVGVKKTLIIGTTTLLFGRFFLPFTESIWLVAFLSFVPMAVGTAIIGPVISVGIKKYTTKEGAALGFGLFYTLMNVGWAAGAWLFDYLREMHGEYGSVEVLSHTFTTYQFIFFVGFLLTIPTFLMVLGMRKGIERTETEIVVREFRKVEGDNPLTIMINTGKHAIKDTIEIMRSVVTERAFWIFMFMLGTLIGVKLVFFHFHYTFPKYGIRVLGEGAKIGSVYGVLNPILIVFIVPVISSLTKKMSSYKMMIIGTTLSAVSVFVAALPTEMFHFMETGMLGELIYDRWLDVPLDGRTPLYMSLTVFIIIFTIGEAFWSPRLMQFTAEIAPEGREGTYISLSILPMFLAKFVAGPMSGWLVQTYTPTDADGIVLDHPHHLMVWVWIGLFAITSPIALVVFNKMFTAAERARDEEHAKAVAEGRKKRLSQENQTISDKKTSLDKPSDKDE